MKSLSEIPEEFRRLCAEYVMPYAYIGQTVLYYAGRGAQAEMAFVTKPCTGHVTLAVLPPGQLNFTPKTNVRYIEDPNLKRMTDANGWWDYTAQVSPDQKTKLYKLARQIEEDRLIEMQSEQDIASLARLGSGYTPPVAQTAQTA